MSWFRWAPYVSMAERRAQAARAMAGLRKKGVDVQPVRIDGRTIARTFWGQGWCDHLEKFSDFANRLPRGQRYVRNGSVCHLEISPGSVTAKVSGSEIYNVDVKIQKLPRSKWRQLKRRCAGRIGSMLELLEGRLSDQVMSVVTDRDSGLFPLPSEIHMRCDCPDWATMCKHVAAVLYGVGARLDQRPELLFLLRGVDHEELISAEADVATATAGAGKGRRRIARRDVAGVFGIELAEDDESARGRNPRRKRRRSAGSAAGKRLRSTGAGARKKTIARERPARGRATAPRKMRRRKSA